MKLEVPSQPSVVEDEYLVSWGIVDYNQDARENRATRCQRTFRDVGGVAHFLRHYEWWNAERSLLWGPYVYRVSRRPVLEGGLEKIRNEMKREQ